MAEVSEQRIFETNAQGFGDSGREAGEKKCFAQVEMTGDFDMIVKVEGVGRIEKIATVLNRIQW